MSKSLWKTPAFEDVFSAFRDLAESIGPRAAVRVLLDVADLPAPAMVEAMQDAQAEEIAAAQEWERTKDQPRDPLTEAGRLTAQAVAVLEIGQGEDLRPDPRALALLRSAAGLLKLQEGRPRAEVAR